MIKAIFTDFDGTLVDTFNANYTAYSEAFSRVGLFLDVQKYRDCFGLRFSEFMEVVGITDSETMMKIRQLKGEIYPLCFDKLLPNKSLIDFMRFSHSQGILTAVASTARRRNLVAALKYIKALDVFDLILSGEDVSAGKPNPEIYLKLLEHFRIASNEALVFEDSDVGLQAAANAGIPTIKVCL